MKKVESVLLEIIFEASKSISKEISSRIVFEEYSKNLRTFFAVSSKSALLGKIFEDSSTYQRLFREYSKEKIFRFSEESLKLL